MVKSLTDPKMSGALQNIKTIPGEPGSNPNINSTIKFNIPLPNDELYCPALSCIVYDQVFLGFSQPQVGTFTIPLGQIMQQNKKDKAELIETARWLVDRLKARLNGQIIEDDIDIHVANNANPLLTTEGNTEMDEIQDENDMKALGNN